MRENETEAHFWKICPLIQVVEVLKAIHLNLLSSVQE
jgi:hypothetical protein